MNPHFTLFREAMARPGNVERAGSGGGFAVAAIVVGVLIAIAVLVPLLAG